MANDKPEAGVPDGFLIASATTTKNGDGFTMTMAVGTLNDKGRPHLDVASSVYDGQPINTERGRLVGTQVGTAIEVLAGNDTRAALSDLFAGNIRDVTAYAINAKDGSRGVLIHVDNDGNRANNERGIYNLAKKGGLKLEAPLDISDPSPYR